MTILRSTTPEAVATQRRRNEQSFKEEVRRVKHVGQEPTRAFSDARGAGILANLA